MAPPAARHDSDRHFRKAIMLEQGSPAPIQQKPQGLARLPSPPAQALPWRCLANFGHRFGGKDMLTGSLRAGAAIMVAGTMLGAALVGSARAQTYPDKPLRFFVPFPAGGSTDAVARAMQPALEKILGQPVVVENRAGAGGMLGVDAVAKAQPDGLTFGIAGAGALGVNIGERVKRMY